MKIQGRSNVWASLDQPAIFFTVVHFFWTQKSLFWNVLAGMCPFFPRCPTRVSSRYHSTFIYPSHHSSIVFFCVTLVATQLCSTHVIWCHTNISENIDANSSVVPTNKTIMALFLLSILFKFLFYMTFMGYFRHVTIKHTLPTLSVT